MIRSIFSLTACVCVCSSFAFQFLRCKSWQHSDVVYCVPLLRQMSCGSSDVFRQRLHASGRSSFALHFKCYWWLRGMFERPAGAALLYLDLDRYS